MKIEHPFIPGIHPRTKMVLELRECATLGTNFADVYLNDQLFARELSYIVANNFVRYPFTFKNAFADIPKMRTWLLEKN